MTRQRLNGNDDAFGAWVRSRRELDSVQASLVVNDKDWMFHKYRVFSDRLGDRTVQLAMDVEVKTLGAVPRLSQKEVLFLRHQALNTMGKVRKFKRLNGEPVSVWNFGYYVLSLQEDAPRDGTLMRWGRFLPSGDLRWSPTMSEKSLIEVLGFKRRPDHPSRPLCLRRHHKTGELEIAEHTPLGIVTYRRVRTRS